MDQDVVLIGSIFNIFYHNFNFNVLTTVMITSLVEKGVKKADPYWPAKIGEKIKFENNIKVKLVSVENVDGLIKRFFTVSNSGNSDS